MTKVYNKKEMTKTRKALRNSMPKAEVILWSHLKGKQFRELKFRRQYSIGHYVVDFFCPKIRLAIELDGESHLSKTQRIRDKTRQKIIEKTGIKILRYYNTDIYENIEGVFTDLGKNVMNQNKN